MAKHRANGEGNIRKRKDGRWEGRYTAGTDPVTGKAIIKNVLGKTQAEVKEKLKKAIAESGELDIKRSGMYTVGEWMDLWYEVYANPRIRESTAVYYKMFIDTHIRPKLGDIKLNQLQTMDIQRLYNELRENGRIRKEIKDKRPRLSVSYIRGMHNMLKACLNSAVEERLILRNPGLAERNRCQDRIQYAGTQQRRIHPCHLHPRHEQGAGTGSGKDGKPAEAGTLSPKAEKRVDSQKTVHPVLFLKNFPFGSNLGQACFSILCTVEMATRFMQTDSAF